MAMTGVYGMANTRLRVSALTALAVLWQWQWQCTAALATTTAVGGKVSVVIMVESYCPCSGAWPYEFKEKLMPQIGELVTLDRFFDASSNPLASQGCCNPSPNKSIPITNVCFHGKAECVADRLQACAQALYPDKCAMQGRGWHDGTAGTKRQSWARHGAKSFVLLELHCASQ